MPRLTKKQVRGILFMWRNPELITLQKLEPFDEDGNFHKYIKQKDLDDIINIVSAAEAEEAKWL